MEKYKKMILRRSQCVLLALFFSISAVWAQTFSVSGIVTDGTQAPMPGVTVSVKGDKIGAVTDVNGRYNISVPDRSSVLVFSFIGFTTQEIKVGSKKQINVELQEDAMMLDEVVAIGYGSVKKSDLTGSVAKVDMEDLTKAAVFF